MKYQKRVCQKNQLTTYQIKNTVSSNRQKFFEEAAKDMGLIPNKSEGDIGFERHPLLI
jgi:dGTPase